VQVANPVFGRADEYGVSRIVEWQPSFHYRCNGDGTVTAAYWSHKFAAWVWEEARPAWADGDAFQGL
jgi:hypothetical protein